jgi:hypothetical protein
LDKDMEEKIKKKAGRKPGSPNKNRMPKTQALMKSTLQGLEMGITYFRNILTSTGPDSKVTEKQKEIAATRLMEIGYRFLTSVDVDEVEEKLKNSGGDLEEGTEKSKKDQVKPVKSNIYAVKDYKPS